MSEETSASTRTPAGFAPIIEHFAARQSEGFAAFLARQSDQVSVDEAALIRNAAAEALRESTRLKLNRVLLLELHAANLAGQLTSLQDSDRFAQFVAHAQDSDFGEHLDRVYPSLRHRLQRLLDLQRSAIEALLARFLADRERLTRWVGQPLGRLTRLALGQGDLHAGGQSVARIEFEGGKVMYKPRSLRIDAVLDAFLVHVFGDVAERIRVPSVLDCGNYGWASHVGHVYCADDVELHTFYRGLGHWLAVLRLLGGTDIHVENLIAAGPVPVVVDVESLFAFAQTSARSPYGDAYDLAHDLIRSSVLRTGIVPFRSPALGFDNVDLSAAGALPGQQPKIHAPVMIGAGTTGARVKIVEVDVASAQNHPAAHPELSRFWDDISAAFLETTQRLRQLDTDGHLEVWMAKFVGCTARDIRRPSTAYVEIGRMLWHPASLHDEPAAIERARDLFVRNAAVVPAAPSSAEEIASEIEDLRHADVPVFAAPLTPDRIEATLRNWRAMRTDLEEMAIRTSLVVTDLNQLYDEPRSGDGRLYFARHPHVGMLEARRRKLAAETVARLLRLAVRGNDGSVTWIAPQASNSGWHVQPLRSDMYSGLAGVVVALAGYRCEVEHQRADDVAGLDQTLEGALRVLAAMTHKEKLESVGAFSGHAGRIWSWVALHDLLGRPELLANALVDAEMLERDTFDSDPCLDIIDGSCGAIVPLLNLAEATNCRRWLDLAACAGHHLERAAIVDEHGARWPTLMCDEPIGGFAHGTSGIAWALGRLVLAGAGSEEDRRRWSELSDAGFQFQNALFDDAIDNWRERQAGSGNIHTWCGGSVGIGLAAIDLYARSIDTRHLRDVRRAVVASTGQWGFSHTLCHGDLSLWELFVRASAIDQERSPVDRNQVTAQVVSAIEEHNGMVGGMTRNAFTPGLMTGLAGVIHTLARMHQECTLPSPLLLERSAAR